MAALSDTEPVRSATCDAIADCVGERRLKHFIPEEKREKASMCKAIDLLIADGEKRGIAIGEKRGIERERRNVERERARAEKAEARVRELEKKLNETCCHHRRF